jgi:hypothetical protein
MILLTSTSDVVKLAALTSGSTIDVHASYVDLGLNNAVTPSRQDTQFTSVTTKTIVSAPAANVQRNVKTLIITNEGGGGGSGDEQIVITHTDGTTTVELIACTIKNGYTLTWSDNDGWRMTDPYGSLVTTSAAAPSQIGITGDGSDFIAVFDGVQTPTGSTRSGSTYFLQRDVFYSQVQVNSGITVIMGSATVAGNPYRMFVNGSIVNNGTISAPGNNAVGATRGTGFPSIAIPGINGVVGVGTAGSTGGTGNGNAGLSVSTSFGGSGGAGGASPTPHTGGAGGVATTPGNTSFPRTGTLALMGFLFDTNPSIEEWTQWNGGAGGGAGAGDGTNAGGGGGGGGGVVLIAAQNFSGTGSYFANGGNGAAGVGGNAGGGGGGGGGVVCLIYTVSLAAGLVSALGGNGGAGSGTGSAGTAGNSGLFLFIPA